jgi:hypothetical protein
VQLHVKENLMIWALQVHQVHKREKSRAQHFPVQSFKLLTKKYLEANQFSHIFECISRCLTNRYRQHMLHLWSPGSLTCNRRKHLKVYTTLKNNEFTFRRRQSRAGVRLIFYCSDWNTIYGNPWEIVVGTSKDVYYQQHSRVYEHFEISTRSILF